MGKELLDQLRDFKHAYDISHVNFFNNGTVTEDERYYASTRIIEDNSLVSFGLIKEVLLNATKMYSRDSEFDRLDLNLLLGLVYAKSDVDEDNKIKANAKPLKDKVRFYTGSVKSFLGDEQTNTCDYYQNGINYQGYINYNKLVALAKKTGLVFTGPDSFEEFKQAILSGEVFDISLTANLQEERDDTPLKRNR